MGGFRPEEQIAPLPLVHVADHRGRIGGALGVIGNAGAGKVHAKADEVRGHLHQHNEQHKKSRTAALLGLIRQKELCLILVRSLRDLLHSHRAAEHGKDIQRKKHQVVDEIQREIDGR